MSFDEIGNNLISKKTMAVFRYCKIAQKNYAARFTRLFGKNIRKVFIANLEDKTFWKSNYNSYNKVKQYKKVLSL